MTRNELRAVKKSFTCLTKTRLRFVAIFCTFGADYTGNLLVDTQLGVKHLL